MRDLSSPSEFKCTIISLLPFELREPKPGLNPGEFVIPASPDGVIPAVLTVKEGTYGIYLDGDRGTIRARTPSTEVARSLFEDYIGAQLAVADDAKPGIYAVTGDWSAEEVMKKFPEELEELKKLQINWFIRLVKMADDSWNRYHQHGAITDLQRHAANALGLSEDKDWMKVSNTKVNDTGKCPACFTVLNDIRQSKCHICGCIINEEQYSKLVFAPKKTLAESLASK